jgi:hypothetical protein
MQNKTGGYRLFSYDSVEIAISFFCFSIILWYFQMVLNYAQPDSAQEA